MLSHVSKRLLVGSIVALSMLACGIVFSPPAHAAVANPTAQAKVSFTFDDGPASNLTNVAPILAQYGYSGTAYITTDCVGVVTIPNKCQSDEKSPSMSWSQIHALQDNYGWEIGSHSKSHPLLTKQSAAKLITELKASRDALVAQGFNPTAFASPYGDYNNKVIEAVANYYTSHRGFADKGYNYYPYNNYLLRVQQVQYGVSVDTVKGYLDQAAANNTWLVLVFHDIKDTPSLNPGHYQYSTADLSEIANYVKSKNIKVSNISEGLVQADEGDNLITNPVNGKNLGNDWTTDQPKRVKVDSTNKGSLPDPKQTIAVTALKNKNIHVFSSEVALKPGSKYVIKGYVNMIQQNANGEVGFYIDEYDAAGNWISGQYMQTISQKYMKDLSFEYSASSVEVAKARLQIIIAANSGIKVYLGNITWIETTSGPAPNPDPQPEPSEVNLLRNGDFSSGLNGWRTDNDSAIKYDESSGSVLLTNISEHNVQLFSSPVIVASSDTYQISADVNAQSLIGVIGFYIDEYDAAGNWISGQYLYTKSDISNQRVSFSYAVSNTNVASANLQVIVSSGTGTVANIDNITWSKQTA